MFSFDFVSNYTNKFFWCKLSLVVKICSWTMRSFLVFTFTFQIVLLLPFSINQSINLYAWTRLRLGKSKLLHYSVVRDLTRVNQKSLLPYVSPKALIFNMYLSHTIGSISNPIRNKMYNLVTPYDRFWISEVHYVFSTWLGFSNFFPQNLHT